MATKTLIKRTDTGSVNITKRAQNDVRRVVVSFLDMATTASGKATFYNEKDEQLEAMKQIHEGVFLANRGLYAAMLTLPGLTETSLRFGVAKLLESRDGQESSLISAEEESKVIDYLARNMSISQLLRIFVFIREERINNSRARKLILRSILGSNSLDFWAVKYRDKLRQALLHAWGMSTATWVKENISKRKTADSKASLRKLIDKHVPENSKFSRKEVYQCVHFILGGNAPAKGYDVPLLKSYIAARQDLKKGKNLPVSILEGIRSNFHPHVTHAEVLELTKNTSMTETEKMRVQRSATKQNVNVDFDPTKQNLVNLYVYALEMGGFDGLKAACERKAVELSRLMPVSYDRIGIVLDTSKSMFGTIEQKRRPMAIALAMRDVLSASARVEAFVNNTGEISDHYGLVQPKNGTSLASALVKVFKEEPDAVYVISDGYENEPAGRVNEVMSRIRGLGIDTPVYQVTPVMAAEAVKKEGAIRKLSDSMSAMPVSSPEGIGLSMIRAALDSDVESGIRALINMTIPKLEGGLRR